MYALKGLQMLVSSLGTSESVVSICEQQLTNTENRMPQPQPPGIGPGPRNLRSPWSPSSTCRVAPGLIRKATCPSAKCLRLFTA